MSILEEARLAHRCGNLKEALDLSEEGLLADGSAKLPPRVRFDLFVLKSNCLNSLGRWQEALVALESASQACEMDSEALVRLKMHRGYLMGSLAKYADCWSLLSQAERVAREHNLSALLAETLWRKGIISIFVGEYDRADESLRSALELVSLKGDDILSGLIVAGLAKNLMFRSEYTAAIPRFEEALATFSKLGYPFYSAIVWSELANCYLHLSDPDKALELFEKSERVFLECGATPNYQVCLANIGNVYRYRREFATAISYYQRALELARELGDQLSMGKWLRNLAQAWFEIGNPALAQGFESEAKVVNDRLEIERQRATGIASSFK